MNLVGAIKQNAEKLRPARNVSADILAPRLVFIICVLALILFGLVMVFSASNVEALDHNESPFSYLSKQVIFCIAGLLCAIAVWRWIPFSAWRGKWLWVCFFGLCLLMILTLFFGTDILGARRWIYIGGASFQPSEFAKIILVLIVAKYYAEYRGNQIPFLHFAILAGGLSLAMLIFIYKGQSDLGTTVICIVGILAVLWIAGISKWLFGAILVVCVLAGIAAVVLSGWRSNRFVFLDPYNDGAGGYGAGYQLIRSIYAFAEGGFFGVGLGNSYEKYQYLPEAETDFIYSIVGNELGFIGCLLVIAIFVVFLISGMMIVYKSKSRFAGSIAGAFIIMIVFQAMVNIMCCVGLAPITGKPLPFLSAGGSSLIATLTMVGFVLAASETESMPDEYEKRRSNFRVNINFKTKKNKEINEEILDQEIKRRVEQVRARARERVRNAPRSYGNRTTSTRPKISDMQVPKLRSAEVKDPKFISENKKQKQSRSKPNSSYKSSTSNSSYNSNSRRGRS